MNPQRTSSPALKLEPNNPTALRLNQMLAAAINQR